MRILLLICLMTALAVALLAPAAVAVDLKIDDTYHPDWITTSGEWTVGTSSSSKYGHNYYWCNQSPTELKSVTFTPDIPIDGRAWEVYVWYSSGIDRSSAARCIIHREGNEDIIVPINQQQNGGMWVYLGTWTLSAGSSNYIRITNEGSDTSKIVVADAVRLYTVGGDEVPPVITNISTEARGNSVTIRWNTDEPATSQVEYGKTTNLGYFSDQDNTLVTSHEVSITGLESEQLYHFKVRSEDGAGNLAVSQEGQFTTGLDDTKPPLISDIVVVPGANSAVIMWMTDEPATSQVEYGTTDQYGSVTELDNGLVTSHMVSVTGLQNSNLYYFRVISADGAWNTAISPGGTFTTTGPDTAPPIISEVASSVTSNSAVITWKTNEFATSQVEYGKTTSYGSATQEDTRLLLNHTVGLTNLEPNTTYHYRVISKDGSGNRAASADYTFKTTALDTVPPVISEVKIVTSSRSCTITWKTDEPSTTQCRYGLTETPDQETPVDANLVTEHSVTLTELTPSTRYYFFLVCADARANTANVGAFSFSTRPADTISPEITNVQADPASNWVIITWMTDEPATSQVEYGDTTAYGTSTILDEALVTSHGMLIAGLAPSTTYHYRVKSKDADGNETISEDFMFTTDGPDLTPPVITEVSVARAMTSATIRWRTNEPGTSQVEYGTTTDYGSQSMLDPEWKTVHSVALTGLQPSTLYHFRVRSIDTAGNEAVSGDYTFETSAADPEYRMIWADTWHNGFLSASETTAFVDTVAAANYNAIVVEVRKAGDAYYISDYEPWASNITPPEGAYDPLQDLINKAHAKGIEVHAWIVTYRAWHTSFPNPPDGHVYKEHGPGTGLYQDWTMRNASGGYAEGASLNVDPGVPGVQNYIASIVKDVVTKYPLVDGVNFDYVRYPGTNWGYNETTKARFRLEYGVDPPTSPLGPGGVPDPYWAVWCNYRRQQVTDLVRKCFVEAMAINPNIKMSVDSVGWEGSNPNTNYEGTPQYANVFQDAKGWMHQHIVDLNILMNYKREFDSVQKPSYRLWADWLPRVANTSGRLAVDGQGVYLNSISGSITQMLYSRTAGANGMCNYSYAVTNKDSQPASDFFTSVKTAVYKTPAPVPDMPWKKAPTTGIIFGTVTDAGHPNDPIYGDWLYKAYVTLTGPVNREVQTDATGTFAFVDLPPGIYTLSIAKPGYRVKAFGGIMLTEGQVIRKDASIESGMFSSPPGAITAGWNLISLPVQPADPYPAVVFDGIPIDGSLYRWDKPSQALVTYTTLGSETFGDVRIDEGYWIVSPSNAIISYEPAQVDPPTEVSIVLPKDGWSIIGCPFLTPRDWNNATVTHGERTISIATARNWGWINSICYWWDNSVPDGGLRCMGLDDDWMDTTTLQPWKGYWIETMIDNVVLTIR